MAHGVYEIWVSDITYIRTKEGRLYLCTIMDLFSSKIIGWSTRANMKVELVLEAFDMAHKTRRPQSRKIFPSAKCEQCKSKRLRRKLKRLGYAQSMTGVNRCFDNAASENLFRSNKNELIRSKVFETRKLAEAAIFEFIEVFYNRARLHSALG